MTDAPNFLEAGLAAMRMQNEQDALDRIAKGADEAARHALAQFSADEWLGVDFAEALLVASRTLRKAARKPSPAVVEAMERCTAAHHAWADVWAEAETAEMASARAPTTAGVPQPSDDIEDPGPIRIKVGLGDIMSTMLKAKRS